MIFVKIVIAEVSQHLRSGFGQWRDNLKVIVQPYLEPYLGGDSFEAVRIGGFDKRCGV